MSSFEIYTLIICLIVYLLLAGLGTFMVLTVLKLMLKLIRCGANDGEILTEYEKTQGKPKKRALDYAVSGLLCFVLLVVFGFSVYVQCTENKYFGDAPTFKVVNSASMSVKNEKNQYLFDNDLNNQFSTFDLILTYEMPKEEDLKLYDIVIYEVDGALVVHRIVKIEEPNERHPDERWFTLQGDAISQTDRFPVKYSQMRGIYRDEKIPFVGSFVAFMQSPAGYMCIILVAMAMVFTPICEKKLEKATKERLAILLATAEPAEASAEEPAQLTEPVAEPTEAPAIEIVIEPEEEPAEELPEEEALEETSTLAVKREQKTFQQKLEENPIARERYQQILELVERISGVRMIESKKNRTFKSGNIPLVRFNIKGKTLNAHLGLDPKEYEGTKYHFTDASSVKAHERYPMRLKLTSDRQVRWTKELLTEKVQKSGLTISQEVQLIPATPAGGQKGKKPLTFQQKLRLYPVAKARYMELKAHLDAFGGVRVIEGKSQVTYKRGNTALVRFAIRGKTLNAYLGLEPKAYENTKYIFTDVSDKERYKRYPMRLKLTSDRQVRWAKELLSKALDKAGKQA